MVKLQLDGVLSLDLSMEEIDIMFGPDITTEAHLAFSSARTHSNNTAEMLAMIEALSVIGLHIPGARDANSCIYFDSKDAAGLCLGTITMQKCVRPYREPGK